MKLTVTVPLSALPRSAWPGSRPTVEVERSTEYGPELRAPHADQLSIMFEAEVTEDYREYDAEVDDTVPAYPGIYKCKNPRLVVER